MTLDKALAAYLKLRTEVERIEAAAKAETAKLKAQMQDLETWVTVKAQEEGLESIKAKGVGTAYWSTHHSCTVASRDAFFAYVKEHDAFDLLENRASKSAVKSFIEAAGEPPPGVNFSSVRVFNLRKAREGEE
jgi:hypothetical protein